MKDQSLINARKKAIEGMIEDLDKLTNDDIERIMVDMDTVDEDGKLFEFCFVIKSVLTIYVNLYNQEEET